MPSNSFAGPGKDDRDNNRKLLRLMSGVPYSKRKARFVAAIAIADKGRTMKIVEDNCKGVIALEESGTHGFGYDSVFLIPRYKKTFGQLGAKVKDKMSHRKKALEKSCAWLKKYLK